MLIPPTDVVRGHKDPLHFGFSARLRRARKALGLKPARLAALAGLSNTVVGYLETEGRVPGVDTVEHLARALGVPACWLAYGEEGPLPFQKKRPQGERPAEGPQGAPGTAEGPLSCEGLPARLQLARSSRGLSRKALGRASSTSDTTVRQIEEGPGLSTIATAEQLARALEVSPCWLAFGVGEGPGDESAEGPPPIKKPRKPAAPRGVRKMRP